MSKVLIVDDQPDVVEPLREALNQRGHDVRTATEGRVGIELGCRFRPDVIVADWMLHDACHGLRVADVVRSVVPTMHTVLITGFDSLDLRAVAESSGVSSYIEKPFDVDRLVREVERLAEEPADPQSTIFAVAEIGPDGKILYANPPARDLLDQTDAGASATDVTQIFGEAAMRQLAAASERWSQIPLAGEQPKQWVLRTRALAETGGWLMVFRDEQQARIEQLPLTGMLLELADPTAPRWPFRGHALLLGPTDWLRRLLSNLLSWAGGICHSTSDDDEARALFNRDVQIDVVLFEPSTEPRAWNDTIEWMRKLRGETVFIQAVVPEQDAWIGTDTTPIAAPGNIGTCLGCSLPVYLFQGEEAGASQPARCHCGRRVIEF